MLRKKAGTSKTKVRSRMKTKMQLLVKESADAGESKKRTRNHVITNNVVKWNFDAISLTKHKIATLSKHCIVRFNIK